MRFLVNCNGYFIFWTYLVGHILGHQKKCIYSLGLLHFHDFGDDLEWEGCIVPESWSTPPRRNRQKFRGFAPLPRNIAISGHHRPELAILRGRGANPRISWRFRLGGAAIYFFRHATLIREMVTNSAKLQHSS